MNNSTPLLKDMDTDSLTAYVDDVQALLFNALAMKKRNIGWLVRQHEIGTAILNKRRREGTA